MLFQIRPLFLVQKYDKKGTAVLEIDLEAERDVSKNNKKVGFSDLRDITKEEFLVATSGNLGMSPEECRVSNNIDHFITFEECTIAEHVVGHLTRQCFQE